MGGPRAARPGAAGRAARTRGREIRPAGAGARPPIGPRSLGSDRGRGLPTADREGADPSRHPVPPVARAVALVADGSVPPPRGPAPLLARLRVDADRDRRWRGP